MVKIGLIGQILLSMFMVSFFYRCIWSDFTILIIIGLFSHNILIRVKVDPKSQNKPTR